MLCLQLDGKTCDGILAIAVEIMYIDLKKKLIALKIVSLSWEVSVIKLKRHFDSFDLGSRCLTRRDQIYRSL